MASAVDRARGALLGTFVGDALGMAYEGSAPETAPRPLEMIDARLGRGTYTDDTQMMIGQTESLLARGCVDPEHLARTFLALYDSRRGYGAGTTEVFRRWQASEPVEEAARRLFGGEGSHGNGAAMRVAPVAVRYAGDIWRVVEEAERSASLTHSHPLGVDAAVVQAVAVAFALCGDDVRLASQQAAATEELRDRLRLAADMPSGASPTEAAQTLGNTSAGHESVPLAIYAATAYERFEDAVTFACGGDSDTIGAMAGAIVGARVGAAQIPERWTLALENGDRGRSHVGELARRLHKPQGSDARATESARALNELKVERKTLRR